MYRVHDERKDMHCIEIQCLIMTQASRYLYVQAAVASSYTSSFAQLMIFLPLRSYTSTPTSRQGHIRSTPQPSPPINQAHPSLPPLRHKTHPPILSIPNPTLHPHPFLSPSLPVHPPAARLLNAATENSTAKQSLLATQSS